MAKLKHMLGEKGISSLKGKFDFYYWMGIPCVRRWPRPPVYRRSARELANQIPFGYASHNWNSLSPEVQQAYRDTAQGSTMTGRDLFVKSFISSYFREGQFD